MKTIYFKIMVLFGLAFILNACKPPDSKIPQASRSLYTTSSSDTCFVKEANSDFVTLGNCQEAKKKQQKCFQHGTKPSKYDSNWYLVKTAPCGNDSLITQQEFDTEKKFRLTYRWFGVGKNTGNCLGDMYGKAYVHDGCPNFSPNIIKWKYNADTQALSFFQTSSSKPLCLTRQIRIGDKLKLQQCWSSTTRAQRAALWLSYYANPALRLAKKLYERQKWDIVGNTIRPADDPNACVKLKVWHQGQGHLVMQRNCDQGPSDYSMVFTPVKK